MLDCLGTLRLMDPVIGDRNFFESRYGFQGLSYQQLANRQT